MPRPKAGGSTPLSSVKEKISRIPKSDTESDSYLVPTQKTVVKKSVRKLNTVVVGRGKPLTPSRSVKLPRGVAGKKEVSKEGRDSKGGEEEREVVKGSEQRTQGETGRNTDLSSVAIPLGLFGAEQTMGILRAFVQLVEGISALVGEVEGVVDSEVHSRRPVKGELPAVQHARKPLAVTDGPSLHKTTATSKRLYENRNLPRDDKKLVDTKPRIPKASDDLGTARQEQGIRPPNAVVRVDKGKRIAITNPVSLNVGTDSRSIKVKKEPLSEERKLSIHSGPQGDSIKLERESPVKVEQKAQDKDGLPNLSCSSTAEADSGSGVTGLDIDFGKLELSDPASSSSQPSSVPPSAEPLFFPSSPGPSSPPTPNEQTSVRHITPLVSDDATDAEWLRRLKTPAKGRKKVVQADSDDEASPLRSVVSTSADVDQQEDWEADDTHPKEEEGESESSAAEGGYNIAKHYDESYGSLRDFIVDDSDDESDGSHDGRRSWRDSRPSEAEEDGFIDNDCSNIDTDSEGDSLHGDEVSDKGDIRPRPRKIQGPSRDKDSRTMKDIPVVPRRRSLTLPDLTTLVISSSPDTSPALISGRKKAQAGPSKGKAWKVEREEIVARIIEELDRKVFGNKLGPQGAGTVIEWNNRLLTTAGTASFNRVRGLDGNPRTAPDGSAIRQAKVMLSEKVLTGENQIINTVAHELCHLACFVIDQDFKAHHGKAFKNWGRRVMRVRPDITVKTTHSYKIEYKYQWRCTRSWCGKVHGRHSKSIDHTKVLCEACGGQMEPLFSSKTATSFQVYLKAHMTHARAAMPGVKHGEVMRALSKQWNEAGPEANHALFWTSMAIAARG